MIRVNCRGCQNFTGTECKQYGDDPMKAAKNCAHDAFVEYIPIKRKRKPSRKSGQGREGGRHGIDRKHRPGTGV